MARVGGKAGVLLADPPGPGVEGDPKAREIRRPEPLLHRPMDDGNAPVSLSEPVRDLARAVRRVVVHHEQVAGFGKLLQNGRDDPLEVLGLVVGREDDPDAVSPGSGCGHGGKIAVTTSFEPCATQRSLLPYAS